MTTIPDLTKLSHAELVKLALEQQAALASSRLTKCSLKVTEKGAISIYGLQRFPVTLYASQWEKIIEMTDQLREFIEANKAKLATKA
jgi:hypothetical protein